MPAWYPPCSEGPPPCFTFRLRWHLYSKSPSNTIAISPPAVAPTTVPASADSLSPCCALMRFSFKLSSVGGAVGGLGGGGKGSGAEGGEGGAAIMAACSTMQIDARMRLACSMVPKR